jgi:hypothetical protein
MGAKSIPLSYMLQLRIGEIKASACKNSADLPRM